MKLLLMRHGEASYSGGRSDKERPLTIHGKEQATRAGAWLKSQGLGPDVILCSSALRTRETWQMLQTSAQITAQAHLLDDLYLANPHELLEAIQSAPADTQCLLIIAHNPGLSTLASALSEQRIGMGTAHVVVFEHTHNYTTLECRFSA